MTTSTSTVVGAPTGFRTITPFVIHDRAPDLVDFMKSTFGAEELKRNTAGEFYGFYSEVRIGDSVVMIGGGTAAGRGNLPGTFHLYVEDCDAARLALVEECEILFLEVAHRSVLIVNDDVDLDKARADADDRLIGTLSEHEGSE